MGCVFSDQNAKYGIILNNLSKTIHTYHYHNKCYTRKWLVVLEKRVKTTEETGNKHLCRNVLYR